MANNTLNNNTYTIVGNIGNIKAEDRVIRNTQTGKQVANFSVAETRYDKETGTESTVWWKVSIWGKDAQLIHTLQKGQRVIVSGRAETRDVEGKIYHDLSVFNGQIGAVMRAGGSVAPAYDDFTSGAEYAPNGSASYGATTRPIDDIPF